MTSRCQTDQTLAAIIGIGPPGNVAKPLQAVDDPSHRRRLHLLSSSEFTHQLIAGVHQNRHGGELIRVEVKRIVPQLAQPSSQSEHRRPKRASKATDSPKIPTAEIDAGALELSYGHASTICLAMLITNAKDHGCGRPVGGIRPYVLADKHRDQALDEVNDEGGGRDVEQRVHLACLAAH
jgi:hypothetical protein